MNNGNSFSKIRNQPNEMVLTMRDSKLENLANGKKGCFPLSQNFRKFRAEVKWKGAFRFGPTGIFGTTSGGGPL